MKLTDAISAVEVAESAMGGADSAKAQAQAKFDAAQAGKVSADQADADAVTAFNASLDTLIVSATAAKVVPAP